MRFIFEYRTSDNVLHKGIVSAASKDAAYALLKSQGIRPGRVIEAPGFFNKLFGKGKRWILIGVLVLLATIAVFHAYYWSGQLHVANTQLHDTANMLQDATNQLQVIKYGPIERQQLMGDQYIIQEGHRNSWREIFSRESDRFLSRFVEPGRVLIKEETIATPAVVSELMSTMNDSVKVEDSDLAEYSQVKRIVAGIRNEMAEYVNEGGTVLEYVHCLVERQRYEGMLRRKAQSEINALKSRLSEERYISEWRKINLRMRSYGLKLIPLDLPLDDM